MIRNFISIIGNKEENMRNFRLIAVDLDGCLVKSVCWTPEECLKAKPNKKIIELVNRIEAGNFIIIYTARRDHLIPASLQWLRKNGVKFHAISNNKMAADVYIDDCAVNPIKKIKL